jgi:hypothetical protein
MEEEKKKKKTLQVPTTLYIQELFYEKRATFKHGRGYLLTHLKNWK